MVERGCKDLDEDLAGPWDRDGEVDERDWVVAGWAWSKRSGGLL